MSNPAHTRLIRQLMSDGYFIRMTDPEFGDELVFKPTPRNFQAAVKEVAAYDGGIPFDVLDDAGERVGTVYTAIGYGNGPDETVADWSSTDHPLARDFARTCERIVCP